MSFRMILTEGELVECSETCTLTNSLLCNVLDVDYLAEDIALQLNFEELMESILSSSSNC